MLDDFLNSLNPMQRKAAELGCENALVLAGAGSGKTKVLVDRLFRYVTEERCNIDDFLIITYTRAAAAELRGQQVQDGFLQAMRSNVRRLDVELHPAELGAITLTLTMRNGEVSAQIRSEKSETAELVSQQLENIRINLEQQGFKVDKLEVGLQNQQKDLAESNDSQWQNMQQHNTWAEQDARREELSRLRNLAMVRNSAGNQENTALAHSMQDTEQTAIYATRRLNVVA